MPRFNSMETADFWFGGSSVVTETEYHGATMVFAQTTAPVGWTKQTTNNDLGLRVINGSTGGTYTTSNQSFSTVINNTYSNFINPEPAVNQPFPVSPFTTTTTYMESHSHSMFPTSFGTLTWPMNPSNPSIAGAAAIVNYPVEHTSGSAGSGGSHTHPAIVNAFSYSSSFGPLGIQYMDVIVATYNY
jgi:hypothetical protein